MITLDLQKRIRTYGGNNLLHVQTSFAALEITEVQGNSGVGKTTLFKIIAGLLRPDAGTLLVHDETWIDSAKKIYFSPQQRAVGFVFQDYALFPNMTVLQHLQYGTNDRKYIDELLALGRMSAFAGHKPGQLSGGQQQRLAIMRALSTRPRILLMDEPFSALDNDLRSGIIMDLKKLITSLHITCLVVTHQSFAPGEFSSQTFRLALPEAFEY